MFDDFVLPTFRSNEVPGALLTVTSLASSYAHLAPAEDSSADGSAVQGGVIDRCLQAAGEVEVLVSIDRKFVVFGDVPPSPQQGVLYFWLGLAQVDVPAELVMAERPAQLSPEQRRRLAVREGALPPPTEKEIEALLVAQYCAWETLGTSHAGQVILKCLMF